MRKFRYKKKSPISSDPMVSIIVITYNSSQFVVETLESTKTQTYQNIELIVCDDCSTDNTVEICRNWLDENKNRFVRTELITVAENTGIPANCNRGLKAAKGEWVKLIAGDDILIANCVETFVNFAKDNINSNMIQSLVSVFGKNIESNSYIIPNLKIRKVFSFSAKKQLVYMYKNNFVIAPGLFAKKSIYENVGYFDEEFKKIEDFPMWLKVLHSGESFRLLDEVLVMYRKHENNVSASVASNTVTPFSTESLLTKIQILKKYKKFDLFNSRKSIIKNNYYLMMNNSKFKNNFFINFLNKVVYKI